MKGVNQKNFGSFFMAWSINQTAKLLNKASRSDKIVRGIILSKVIKIFDIRKKGNMKPNFFSQISDHQQSVALAPAPSRGLPHFFSSAGGR
ncbi:MAG: hypothetical protein KJP23_05640 [Deltaproteobacteria bacterium]|nr:hypothetical protein [Deltaproteobacteria bacterium]